MWKRLSFVRCVAACELVNHYFWNEVYLVCVRFMYTISLKYIHSCHPPPLKWIHIVFTIYNIFFRLLMYTVFKYLRSLINWKKSKMKMTFCSPGWKECWYLLFVCYGMHLDQDMAECLEQHCPVPVSVSSASLSLLSLYSVSCSGSWALNALHIV